MSEITEDISYLSQEIGPRPAGTEEEQQAALYIADQMQKRTGFAANIEDFNTATQPGLVEAICFGVAAAISLLAIIFKGLVAPAFLITLACAILYAFELIDRPLLSQLLSRGVSQNVVTRYTPGTQQARGRKVVLVANYDSSKVQSELNGGLFKLYPQLQKAAAIALIALPVIWLIRVLFSGAVLFFNLLAALALLLALVPVAIFFMHKASTYNEAANNNAAGVAAMLEVARLIAEGTLSEEEIAKAAERKTHSAEEAYAAGVVPEGAELEYAEGLEQTEEERLASAKAALVALTGQPLREYQVEQIEFTPMAQRDDIELYNEDMDYGEYAYPEDEELTEAFQPVAARVSASEDVSAAVAESGTAQEAEPAEAALAEDNAAAEEAVPAAATAMDAAIIANEAEAKSRISAIPEPAAIPAPPTNEPAWFTTGRAKAVKHASADNVPIRRSRYADALDAAVASSKAHFDEAARMLDEGTIERISEMQRKISTRTSDANINAAPLQDLLSDENKPADALEVAEEEATEPAEATIVSVSEDQSIASEVEIEASEATNEEAQPVAAEATEEEQPTPENNGKEEPAESVAASESVADATIAMAPINVDTLKQASEAVPSATPEHDFSKIDAPPRRYRNIILPAFEGEATEASSAPARYSNPLVSERIPRIDASASKPISVMEDLEPVKQSADEAPATPAPAAPAPAPSAPANEESVEDKRAALRNAIPSLSGEFSPVSVNEAIREEENAEVSKTGSFATAGTSITLEPVGDELVADLAPEERYVEDADDSSYDENTTETGAFAGPDYVDMPESRLSRFFSRFRKKKDVEEESTHEWLDVDESFTATEVGAARGSWESFRTDVDDATEETINETAEGAADDVPEAIAESGEHDFSEEGEQNSLFSEYEYVDIDEEDERSWHGGAFSQMRARLLREESTEEAAAELVEEVEDELASQAIENTPVVKRVASVSTPLVDTTEDVRIAEEVKMIYSFRNPDVNTEVWFVALGAEYAGNSGMKAFLAEHADDLRGAIIINMEALGAGELCFIEEEGLLIAQKPSSRLKRFLHKATDITGVSTSRASITWRESAASLAMRRGLQAMTLAGMEDGKPALIGQGDDVLENIDEHTVKDNAQFVLELIKNI